MSERETIAATAGSPATIESLYDDLQSLSVAPGCLLLVHSSLSALGWVCGREVAVVEALSRAVGEDGTLVMPAHSSDVSDPAHWSNPPVPESWWPIIREQMPPYDPRRTPTRGMGVIAECFRNAPGVLRSDHPQDSFAARGPLADAILANHALPCSLGENSPLARLYENDAQVVLLGVGHDSNTSLHLAEVRALGDAMKSTRNGAPAMVNGRREWVEFDEPNYDTSDFLALGAAFAKETGLVRSGKVGDGDALLLPQVALVDFAVAWFREHRTA